MRGIRADVYRSPAYQELIEAVRADDHVRQAAIVEAEIARLDGADKAMWLLIRSGRKLRQNLPLPGPIWADLEEALQVGGYSAEVRSGVLLNALNLGMMYERLGCIWLHLRSLPDLKVMLRDHQVQGLMGVLALQRGRWAAAFRHFNAYERGFRQLPEGRQTAFRGELLGMITRRAVAAFASGRPEQGLRDVGTMEQMLLTALKTSTSPSVVALARAERALYLGEFQEARAALQRGAVQAASGNYYKERVNSKVDLELMAARIARAEGNPTAFAHFCSRAEKLIEHQGLPLTRARIEAVRAGAPR